MTERERQDLEQRALTMRPSDLHAMTKDARPEAVAVARRELARRDRAQQRANSLTGVVEPL